MTSALGEAKKGMRAGGTCPAMAELRAAVMAISEPMIGDRYCVRCLTAQLAREFVPAAARSVTSSWQPKIPLTLSLSSSFFSCLPRTASVTVDQHSQ